MGKLKLQKGALSKAREAASQQGDFENIDAPPGRYYGAIIDGRLVDTKNGTQVVIDFKIPEVSKDAKGGIFYSLEEDRLQYLLKTLSRLGIDTSELDESKFDKQLEEIFTHLRSAKPVVRITVKENDEYKNYYIDKLVENMTFKELVAEAGGEAPAEPAKKEEKSKKEKTPAAEEQEEEEAEEPAKEEGDDLSKLSRPKLKNLIKEKKLDIKVVRSMSDDDVRKAIKDALAKGGGEEAEEQEEEEEEEPPAKESEGVEIKAGMKMPAVVSGVEQEVEILEVLEAEGKVRVKTKDGKKFKIPGENLRPA